MDEEARCAPEAACVWQRWVGVALGAAALGGLGVWLYLRANGNPQDRASHRIEGLRQRIDALTVELARLTERTQPEGESGRE